MDTDPAVETEETAPAKEPKGPKYMIMTAVTGSGTGGGMVKGVWKEHRNDNGPVLFETSGEAYRYARDSAIESCMVVKRHGMQKILTKVQGHQELF